MSNSELTDHKLKCTNRRGDLQLNLHSHQSCANHRTNRNDSYKQIWW